MRRRHLGADASLSLRMGIVMFLLAATYVAFLTFLWGIGLDTAWLVVVAVLLVTFQYLFSDRLVLLAAGAREVSASEEPELHARVQRLAALADLPPPKVAIMEHKMPNAFAAGRSPRASVVAVTRGLLERLDEAELDAVIAHELSHIRHRDAMVITLASFFSTVAFFVVRAFMYVRWGYSGRRRQGNALILVWLVSLVVWFVSLLLLRALSRYREYAADRGAALLIGGPSHLASALIKISDEMGRIPLRDLREVQGANAFFIIPALTGQSILELFSTHPPLEKRLERLRRLEREMEGL